MVTHVSVEIRSISFSPTILNKVSFKITPGSWTAMIGPNGAGKSTLLKIVAGVLPLGAGQVIYRGEDFSNFPRRKQAQKIAYLGSDLRTEFPLKADEAVALGLSCRDSGSYSLVAEAMQRCFCWHLKDRFLPTLSGGERQLVALARVLVQGADVLLLDEILSKMDLNHQMAAGKILNDLRSKGISIVLVSHDINLACAWADTAILMKKGEITYQGSVRDAITQERLEFLYPDSQWVIGTHPLTGAPQVFFGTK